MDKITRLCVTVEFTVSPNEMIDEQTLEEDLLGQFVKIKSGAYENALVGVVTSVNEKLQRTPREDI
jgi:hypothetical protein